VYVYVYVYMNEDMSMSRRKQGGREGVGWKCAGKHRYAQPKMRRE